MREVRFARDGPESQRCLADKCRSRRVDPTDDKGDQISGHLDCVGEAQNFLVSLNGLRCEGAVRNSAKRSVDHQCRGEDGFEVRFIPAWKGASGVRRFELRGCHRLVCTGLVFIGAAIEPSELIVKRTLKGDVQLPLARSHWLKDRQSASLEGLIQFNRGLLTLAMPAFDDRAADDKVRSVQDNGPGCL